MSLFGGRFSSDPDELTGGVQEIESKQRRGEYKPDDVGPAREVVKGLQDWGRSTGEAVLATVGSILPGEDPAERAYRDAQLDREFRQQNRPADGFLNKSFNLIGRGIGEAAMFAIPQIGAAKLAGSAAKATVGFKLLSRAAKLKKVEAFAGRATSSVMAANIAMRAHGENFYKFNDQGKNALASHLIAGVLDLFEYKIENAMGFQAGLNNRLKNRVAKRVVDFVDDAPEASRLLKNMARGARKSKPSSWPTVVLKNTVGETLEEDISYIGNMLMDAVVSDKTDASMKEFWQTTIDSFGVALPGALFFGTGEYMQQRSAEKVSKVLAEKPKVDNPEAMAMVVELQSVMQELGATKEQSAKWGSVAYNVAANLAEIDGTTPKAFFDELSIAIVTDNKVDLSRMQEAKNDDERLAYLRELVPAFDDRIYNLADTMRAEEVNIENASLLSVNQEEGGKWYAEDTQPLAEQLGSALAGQEVGPDGLALYVDSMQEMADADFWRAVYTHGVVNGIEINGENHALQMFDDGSVLVSKADAPADTKEWNPHVAQSTRNRTLRTHGERMAATDDILRSANVEKGEADEAVALNLWARRVDTGEALLPETAGARQAAEERATLIAERERLIAETPQIEELDAGQRALPENAEAAERLRVLEDIDRRIAATPQVGPLDTGTRTLPEHMSIAERVQAGQIGKAADVETKPFAEGADVLPDTGERNPFLEMPINEINDAAKGVTKVALSGIETKGTPNAQAIEAMQALIGKDTLSKKALTALEQEKPELFVHRQKETEITTTTEQGARATVEASKRLRPSGGWFSANGSKLNAQYIPNAKLALFYEGATAEDVVHEWLHHAISENLIPQRHMDVLLENYKGAGAETWDKNSQEQIVSAFLTYISKGGTPGDPKLTATMEYLAEIMQGSWRATEGFLTPETSAVFGEWFGSRKASAEQQAQGVAVAEATAEASELLGSVVPGQTQPAQSDAVQLTAAQAESIRNQIDVVREAYRDEIRSILDKVAVKHEQSFEGTLSEGASSTLGVYMERLITEPPSSYAAEPGKGKWEARGKDYIRLSDIPEDVTKAEIGLSLTSWESYYAQEGAIRRVAESFLDESDVERLMDLTGQTRRSLVSMKQQLGDIGYAKPLPAQAPLLASAQPTQSERIASVALRFDDGTIIKAQEGEGIHAQLYQRLVDEKSPYANDRGSPQSGYLTESGKYVTQPEAMAQIPMNGARFDALGKTIDSSLLASITPTLTRANANAKIHAIFDDHPAAVAAAQAKFGKDVSLAAEPVAGKRKISDEDLIAWADELGKSQQGKAHGVSMHKYGVPRSELTPDQLQDVDSINRYMNEMKPVKPKGKVKVDVEPESVPALIKDTESRPRTKPVVAKAMGGDTAMAGIMNRWNNTVAGVKKWQRNILSGVVREQFTDWRGMMDTMADGDMKSPWVTDVYQTMLDAQQKWVVKSQEIGEWFRETEDRLGRLDQNLHKTIDLNGSLRTRNDVLFLYLLGRGDPTRMESLKLKAANLEYSTDHNGNQSDEIFNANITEAAKMVKADAGLARTSKIIEEFYSYIYKEINTVYKRINNKDLGKVDFYFPMMREGGLFMDEDWLGELAGITPQKINAQRKAFNMLRQRQFTDQGGKIQSNVYSVFQHYRSQAAVFIAKQESLMRISQQLGEKSLQAAVNKRFDSDDQMKTLQTMVEQQRFSTGRVEPMKKSEMILKAVRTYAVGGTLALNLPSAQRQAISMLNYMGEVDNATAVSAAARWGCNFVKAIRNIPRLGSRHQNFLSDDPTWQRMITMGSKETLSRFDPVYADMSEAMGNHFYNKVFKGLPIREWLFMGQRLFDQVTRVSAWGAAFDSEVARLQSDGMSEAEAEKQAFRFAEDVLGKTQPGTTPLEKVGAQTGNELVRMAIPYTGQLMKNFNYIRTEVVRPLRRAFEASKGKPTSERIAVMYETFVSSNEYSSRSIARKIFFSNVLPVLAFGLIARGRIPEDWEEMGRDIVGYNISAVPIIGPVISMYMLYQGWDRGHSPMYLGFTEEMGKTVDTVIENDPNGKDWKEIGSKALYATRFFGLPAQLLRIPMRMQRWENTDIGFLDISKDVLLRLSPDERTMREAISEWDYGVWSKGE